MTAPDMSDPLPSFIKIPTRLPVPAVPHYSLCSDCGASVIDWDKHELWHKAIQVSFAVMGAGIAANDPEGAMNDPELRAVVEWVTGEKLDDWD